MKFLSRPFEILLSLFITRQAKRIDDLINQFIFDSVRQSTRFVKRETNDFFFSNYPSLSRKIDGLLRLLSISLMKTIQTGSEWSWDLANQKNDSLLEKVLSSIGKERVPELALARWNQKNLNALKAFEERRIGGMGLSDKVWAYTQGIKGDLELALDLGIGEGMSADKLAQMVQQYLKEPNRLYRRVRDEKGILRLSKSAANYHPGQGVYRSSYKNAKRLAATETNMAYRTADNERMNQIDFILGYEVHISDTNHTCLNAKGEPEPFFDICDELQGPYPKWFIFKGWHPNCRCYVTTILPDRKEFINYLAAMDENGVSSYKLAGEITDVNPKLTDWLERNQDRVMRAKSLPYFIKDNPSIAISDAMKKKIDYERLTDGLRNQERNDIPKVTETMTPELREKFSRFAIEGSDERDFTQNLLAKEDVLVKPTGEQWLKSDVATRGALIKYTDGDEYCSQINNCARNIGEGHSKEISVMVKQMKKFIRGCPLQEDMILCRGASYDEINAVFGKNAIDTILEGKTHLMKKLGTQTGFMSTSFTEFGGYKLGHDARTKVEMRIFAPKGTQGAFMKCISQNDLDKGIGWDGRLPKNTDFHSGDENEILLNMGMIMKVLGYEVLDAEKGWIRILCRIVGKR